MTLLADNGRIEYPGNGVALEFNGPKVFAAADLKVYEVDDTTGAETLLTNPTDYEVTGIGLAQSTVTRVAVTAVGKTLVLAREVEVAQSTSIKNQGAYLPEVIEDAFDRVYMVLQQFANGIGLGRVLSLFVGDTDGSGRFNGNGNRIVDLADGVDPTDAATVQQLTSAGSGSFIQAGSGASIRSMQEKARDIVSVKDYGAIGDGVTDDTAAAKAGILYLQSIGGGTLYFPRGTYRLTATLTINSNGVHLRGAGMWNTILTRSGDYGDTVKFTGDDATGTMLTDVGFSGFSIKSTGLTTSGAHLRLIGIARMTISDVYMLAGYRGIHASGLTAAYIHNTYFVFANIFGGSASGRRYAQFDSAAATYAHPSCGDVFISNYNWRGNIANTVTEIGIEIQSADGIWFDSGHVGNTTVANLRLNNAIAAEHIGLIFFDNAMFDEAQGTGVTFNGSSNVGRNIYFTGCNFKGGASGTVGISVASGATFNNVQFVNCFVSEYNSHGVSFAGATNTAKNFDFIGCQVRGNSYTSTNTAEGYSIGSGENIRILGGCSGGGNVVPATATQRFGISVGANPTGVMISDVDLTNNLTGSLSINASAILQTAVSGVRSQDSSSVVAAATITLPAATDVITVTGNTNISTITASRNGRRVSLIFTGTPTVNDGSNLVLNGNFVATADDTLSLVCNGTNWYETGRSVN